MGLFRKKSYPSFLVPEVVQTSSMDCGPASLKALLEGYGIHTSYGRLREACHTDVDGTSIDTLETIAQEAGLNAKQILIPSEHLLRPENHNLPGIAVVKLPNGNTHFLVVWRILKGFVQVMDPAKGRRWIPKKEFLQDLYVHRHPIPAESWKNYAFSNRFTLDLIGRMTDLQIHEETAKSYIELAKEQDTWEAIATLDASIRFVSSMVDSGGLLRGEEATTAVSKFVDNQGSKDGNPLKIPSIYWPVQAIPNDEEKRLLVKGSVFIFVKGKTSEEDSKVKCESPSNEKETSPKKPVALDKILVFDKETPTFALFKYLKADGLLTPSLITASLFITSIATIIEALLFIGLLKIGDTLSLADYNFGAGILFLTFFVGILISEVFINHSVARMGRKLEIRLRSAFLEKIPKLGDRYFHSRLTSDMAQRAHELRDIRNLPQLGFGFMRNIFRILFVAGGIIWLDPNSFILAVSGTFLAIVVSLVFHPVLVELDLRLMTHNSALSRFYLDSLIGLLPIRTHSASRPIRIEHESLLVEWMRAGLDLLGSQVFIQFCQALVGTIFSIIILFYYVQSGGEPTGVLLLFYWVLSLPALAQTLARYANQYPMYRNRMLRYLEPLSAPEEAEFDSDKEVQNAFISKNKGLQLNFDHVHLENNGHSILKDIHFSAQAGEHISIVGPSGAGKSSLVGLLLGWDQPSKGSVYVEEKKLEGPWIELLRREIVWLDPSVQLWNRSLIENLKYGSGSVSNNEITQVLESADLFHLLEKMPQGMQTKLGESGGFVSGGEGQRVRLGRALLKKAPKLVILDEPFRGLDSEKRKQFIKDAKIHWKDSTLLFISHDIEDTRLTGRVLVMENGSIIEDGAPKNLLRRKNSVYKDLYNAEKQSKDQIWNPSNWKHFKVSNSKIEKMF